MKKTVPFFLTAMLLVVAFSVAQAQPGGPPMDPEQRAKQQTRQMTSALALSSEQATQVESINLKYAQKMQEARNAASGDWTQMRETMMAINQEKDEELKQVLTEEQFSKWRQIQAESRGGRGPQGPPADQPKKEKVRKPKKEKSRTEQNQTGN